MLLGINHIENISTLSESHLFKINIGNELNFEIGSFIIKTAETNIEFIESLKLRHEVFFNELKGSSIIGIDMDEFDFSFDHLIIKDKKSDKIVGTYRIRSIDINSNSYTGKEFNILSIFEGNKNVVEYLKLACANKLIGCTSLKIRDPKTTGLVFRYLTEKGAVKLINKCEPTSDFIISDFEIWYDYYKNKLNQDLRAFAESKIPQLLNMYIKFGAKIICNPAYDAEFDCVDFLTLLNTSNVPDALARKFNIVKL